jgi:probable phosphoglycerate mutase
MSIYLARHGETDWNRQGKMQGRLGASLNELGRAQAMALARVAGELDVTTIISSPLGRALETARLVSAETGREIVVCDALMEIDFGDCSGLTEAETAARYPHLKAERLADKWHHRWPQGESYADAVRRLEHALAAGALPGKPGALLIAHQSVNRALAHLLSGHSPSEMLQMSQRSDVLLRFSPGQDKGLHHAMIAESDGPLVWQAGPFLGGRANLN